jgi:hypothetical protein
MDYYFGAPGRRPTKKNPTPDSPSSGVSKRPRRLAPIRGSAPITSANRPVGGAPGLSVNNELTTMIFGGLMYNKFYGQHSAQDVEERFWFIPFKNDGNDAGPGPEINPDDGIRIPNNELVENVNIFKVTIREHLFTTQNTLPVLSAIYNGARLKIKWAPKPGGSRSPPYYYVEVYGGPGLPMKKVWGIMGIMGTGGSRAAGSSEFGKTKSSEIRYLKKFV